MNLVGLNNIGNTCYLNSGLQLIISNENLVNYYLENEFKNEKSKIFKNFFRRI